MVADFKCKEECPYHCKSWSVHVGGYEWNNRAGGYLEDKTLSLRVGNWIFKIEIFWFYCYFPFSFPSSYRFYKTWFCILLKQLAITFFVAMVVHARYQKDLLNAHVKKDSEESIVKMVRNLRIFIFNQLTCKLTNQILNVEYLSILPKFTAIATKNVKTDKYAALERFVKPCSVRYRTIKSISTYLSQIIDVLLYSKLNIFIIFW